MSGVALGRRAFGVTSKKLLPNPRPRRFRFSRKDFRSELLRLVRSLIYSESFLGARCQVRVRLHSAACGPGAVPAPFSGEVERSWHLAADQLPGTGRLVSGLTLLLRGEASPRPRA